MSRIHSVGRFRKPMIVLMAGALALSMSGAVGAASPSSERRHQGVRHQEHQGRSAEHLRQPDLLPQQRGLPLLERHRSDGCHRRPRVRPALRGAAWRTGPSKGAPVQPRGSRPARNGTNGSLPVLTGPTGSTGTNGTDEDGTMAPTATDGADGADGADGKSAYQVAVDNGFVGETRRTWLASLKGAGGSRTATDGADRRRSGQGRAPTATDGQDGA